MHARLSYFEIFVALHYFIKAHDRIRITYGRIIIATYIMHLEAIFQNENRFKSSNRMLRSEKFEQKINP
jgi:hypothetical protein